MKYKSFKTFVSEELDDNPNPKSGSLEVDRTKLNTGSMKIDPNKHVALRRIAIAMIKDKFSDNTDLRDSDHHRTMKSLIDAGVKPKELISLNADAKRELNVPANMGGRLHKLARKFQEDDK